MLNILTGCFKVLATRVGTLVFSGFRLPQFVQKRQNLVNALLPSILLLGCFCFEQEGNWPKAVWDSERFMGGIVPMPINLYWKFLQQNYPSHKPLHVPDSPGTPTGHRICFLAVQSRRRLERAGGSKSCSNLVLGLPLPEFCLEVWANSEGSEHPEEPRP